MKHLLFIFLFVSLSVQAKVTLPAIYSDGMVLQRNQPIRIWGQADPKEKINLIRRAKTNSKSRWQGILGSESESSGSWRPLPTANHRKRKPNKYQGYSYRRCMVM